MRLVLLLLLVLLTGCDRTSPKPLVDLGQDMPTPTTISALDSLVGEDGSVSINGLVTDHVADARELILDDGTGLVRVEIPEDVPGLVGHRLFVRGELQREDGNPVLRAVEWLYDSTAISVHSD